MKNKSIVTESEEIQLAAELIRLGARLQLLEAETNLSRERLLKLYKEVKGVSPPKGMLPFSTDWFLTWQPNVHASLFMSFYHFMREQAHLDGLGAVVKSYKLYLEHIQLHGMDCVLSLTRAWTLVRFFDADMLKTTACHDCTGHYVVHAQDLHKHFTCGLCHVPARAGKTKRYAQAQLLAAAM